MTILFPWLALVSFPLLPAFATLYFYQRGFVSTVILYAIIAVLLSLLLGWVFGWFFLMLLAGPLLIREWAIKFKLTLASEVIISCVLIFMLLLALNVFLFSQAKIDIVKVEQKFIDQFIAEQRQKLKESTRSPSEYEPQLQLIEEMLKILPYLFPSALGLFALWITGINIYASNFLLKRSGLPFLGLPPVSRWQLPWYFSWGYLLGLISLVLSRIVLNHAFALSVFSANLLVFFGTVFMLQGLAVTLFFLERFEVGAIRCFIVLLLAFVTHLLLQTMTWLGLLDTWFNFRQLPPSAPAPKTLSD